MKRFPRLALAIILVMMSSFTFAPVSSQEMSTPESGVPEVLIALRPADLPEGSRFEATADPGSTVEFTAVMENFGTEPIELRTYVSNLLPNVNGGFNMDSIDADPIGVTSWVSYATEEFTLQPNGALERPLSVSVPAGTPPGQYVSAVALETVKPVQVSGSIEQYFRKAITIYVTVPGEISSDYEVGEPEIIVENGTAFLWMPISNTGNVRLNLFVEYEFKDSSGVVITSSQAQLGMIYTLQSTYLALPLASIPAEGEYSLSLTLTNKDDDVSKQVFTEAKVNAPAVEVESPITIEAVTVEANASPIVFADVSVQLKSSQAYRSTRLTVSVFHNGEPVEDFVLADNLSIPAGESITVSQRYLPATNWESGTYTFSLRLESTEGGQTSLLLGVEAAANLEVP